MIYGANSTVSIFHLVYTASGSSYPVTADEQGVTAYIESQRAEVVAVLGEGFNMEIFSMNVDPVPIDIGDKVVDDRGTEYRVTGVERHENNLDTDDVYNVTLTKQRHATH